MNKPKPLDPALEAKNRQTAKRICAGMFVIYNAYFGAVTAMAPNPAESASRAWRHVAGNCLGFTALAEPLPELAEKRLWAPLAVATCVFSAAGGVGTAIGGQFPARHPSTSP